ncbi:MAG: sodium:alanine symporter family protein [Ruminococcaceae bacterium]|nr:sodium:alanine symporter family protein [Oscillospiraceae bacterium]
MEFINKYIFGTAVPVMLILAGIFFAFVLKCFHITRLPQILRVFTKKSPEGGISPFRAVTLALAGTLGVGNIVGVAAAVMLGGFGSVFWMWVSALCAMLLKYAEIVLAMRHRKYEEDGKPHGAAMYYIKDFFVSHSLPRIGKAIAAVFALLCILNALSMGSMMQANAISESMEGVFGVSPVLCGALLCLLCFIIVNRGTEVMARFTEILVPLMTLGYIVISLAVLIIRRDALGDAFMLIINDALSPESATGGIVGFLLSRALRFGTMRGLVSNEAGCGTAPAAHASSNAKSAPEQGFWGIFEVFTDTIILCTMTALVLIVNFDGLKYRGSYIMLTIDAYSSVLGNYASIFLGISVLCFGFATIICWAHYGIESVRYLSDKKIIKNTFIAIYAISAFMGGIISSESVWGVADLAIGGMTIINVVIICLMYKEVKSDTEDYFSSPVKNKKILKKGVDKD